MFQNTQKTTSGMLRQNMNCQIVGLILVLTLSACSNSGQTAKPLSPEAQKRIRAQQEAKEQQERNNQERAMNFQIQLQNRQEQLELDKLRTERAAQRNADREARRVEDEQSQ